MQSQQVFFQYFVCYEVFSFPLELYHYSDIGYLILLLFSLPVTPSLTDNIYRSDKRMSPTACLQLLLYMKSGYAAGLVDVKLTSDVC
jgi:hypothetical protein